MTAGRGPMGIGVIGCGNISDEYLRTMGRFPDLRIMVVADLDRERAAAQAAKYAVAAADSTADLLARADVELVVNLTVPVVHAEVGLQAIAAGKHLWSEKPIATDRAAGRALLAAADAAGLVLGVAPDTVLGPGIQTARRIVERGDIGRPLTALAIMQNPGPDRWHPDPAFLYRAGAGPLFDLGPYYLTTLVHMLGPIVRVTALGTKAQATRVVAQGPRAGTTFPVEVPTHVAALVEFEAGTTATLVFSFESPLRRGLIEITGSDATLEVPDPNWFGGDIRIIPPRNEDASTVDCRGGRVRSRARRTRHGARHPGRRAAAGIGRARVPRARRHGRDRGVDRRRDGLPDRKPGGPSADRAGRLGGHDGDPVAMATTAIDRDADLALAIRHAPIVWFDDNEPFLPQAVGYAVLRRPTHSPTFERFLHLDVPGGRTAAAVIEYALWTDWDIQHLYELEHVWSYVDDAGRLLHAEASWHGEWAPLVQAGRLSAEDERPVAWAQPGKHAMAPDPAAFTGVDAYRLLVAAEARPPAQGGLHVVPMMRGRLAGLCVATRSHGRTSTAGPSSRRSGSAAARTPGRCRSSRPPGSSTGSRPHPLGPARLDAGRGAPAASGGAVDLATPSWSRRPRRRRPRGDPAGRPVPRGGRARLVAQARGLPGRARRGHADRDSAATSCASTASRTRSTCSRSRESVGADKPDPRMFLHALAGSRATAVRGRPRRDGGEPPDRDVRGANQLGLPSVLMRHNDRYPATATEAGDAPALTVTSHAELHEAIRTLG